jgi:hypothetical protein
LLELRELITSLWNMQVCYFCGKSVPEVEAITKEHVFGRWSEAALPAQPPNHAVTASVFDPATGVQRDRSYRAPTPVSAASVHGYCNDCNSGWMNGLDEAVRVHGSKLFYGHELDLPVELKSSVASWATKLAMVKDTQDYKDSGAISQERRSWLYTEQTPPPRTWVWAACLPEEAGTLAIRHQTRFLGTDWFANPKGADLAGIKANASFTTFSYHALLIVVASVDNTGGHRLYDPAELFPRVVVRLWPNPVEGPWPPQSTISNALIAELSDGDWILSMPVSEGRSPEGRRYIEVDAPE